MLPCPYPAESKVGGSLGAGAGDGLPPRSPGPTRPAADKLFARANRPAARHTVRYTTQTSWHAARRRGVHPCMPPLQPQSSNAAGSLLQEGVQAVFGRKAVPFLPADLQSSANLKLESVCSAAVQEGNST